MSTSIGEQLAESQKEIDMDRSALTSYLTERLASDDQILSRLPGIVSQIATEPQSTDDEKSVEQWCKAIVSFRTGEIKARVDTVYLKNLATASANGHSQLSEQEAKEQKLALQAEMEELHSEIASVAEMVVEHELRKPMSEMKERRDREVSQARSAWLTYVCHSPFIFAYSIDNTRSFPHWNIWGNALIPSQAVPAMQTSTNMHWHTSVKLPRNECPLRQPCGLHHLDGQQLLHHHWPSHPWSN